MANDGLFDADQYLRPGARPKRPKATRPPPAPLATPGIAGTSWTVIDDRQRAVVHFRQGGSSPLGLTKTRCDRYGAPRTFDPTEVVPCCNECVNRGAPLRRPGER